MYVALSAIWVIWSRRDSTITCIIYFSVIDNSTCNANKGQKTSEEKIQYRSAIMNK